MKIPPGLQSLVDDGIIDSVLHQLKSGKEASVFVVRRGEHIRCAKVYKDAKQRGFHKLAEYQEGRKARGSRDTRAMGRRSQHGRRMQEAEWKNAEVDALYTLSAAGVRVPEPQGVYDGVLLMELILDADGHPAPRLNDVAFSHEQALAWHGFMIGQIVRMLCAGLIHGDLSEYNILIDAGGPVIIDLPQAVDAATNNNAFRMLRRDVENMRDTFARAAPELSGSDYAFEIWALFERGELTPDALLTGHFDHPTEAADVDLVLDIIDDARSEAEARQRGRDIAESADD